MFNRLTHAHQKVWMEVFKQKDECLLVFLVTHSTFTLLQIRNRKTPCFFLCSTDCDTDSPIPKDTNMHTQSSHPVELIIMLGLICFLGHLFIIFMISDVFLCWYLVHAWFVFWHHPHPYRLTAVSTEYLGWLYTGLGFQTPQAPVRMSWAESDGKCGGNYSSFARIHATLNVLDGSFSHQKTVFPCMS